MATHPVLVSIIIFLFVNRFLSARHPVLASIIFILFGNKILFEVSHFVYHTIGVLEDMIGGVVDAILRICAQAALKFGELLIPVLVLYIGAKIGLNLVEKLAVNPVENIREYLVDPIQEYVEERRAANYAVWEEYVVVPVGDCVAETIKNYVLAPIRKYMVAPIQKCGTEMAPIREYVLALIQKYMLAPIQNYEIEMAPIREYVVAAIQRLFRKLRYKRKIRKLRAQIENLRKITEVVVKAVDAAQENREVTLPNVTVWLTSANRITEASMDDVERVVELYFESFEPTDINREEARSVGAIFTNPTFFVIFLFFCLVLIYSTKTGSFLATTYEPQGMCLEESECAAILEKAKSLCMCHSLTQARSL